MAEKLEKIPLESIEEFMDFEYDEKCEESMADQVCEYFKRKFMDVIEDIKIEDAMNRDERHAKLIFNTEKQLTFYRSLAHSLVDNFVRLVLALFWFVFLVCMCVFVFVLYLL